MATGGQNEVGWNLVHVGKFKLENPNETPRYNSIVICQNKIIVVDIKDNKVKIHRLHDGKLLDTLDSDSRPRAICLMDATTICVLHRDGLIEMASIKSENVWPVFTRMKIFRLDGVFDRYNSVVKVKDNLVVVGVKQDTTYWCIASLDDGHVDKIHRICKESLLSSVTTKDNIIYISCDAGVNDDTGVYAFDILNPSQCKYKYKHQRLRYPRSIVINEDGNIFVGNGVYNENKGLFDTFVRFVFLDPCIHQLTASCQLVAIFTPQGIPRYLQAMFWDNGRLYVTCYWSHDITVFRHVYQGSSKESEVLVSHERKLPGIEESAIHKSQGNVDKGQSNVKTAVPPSGQRLKDSEHGNQDQNPEKHTSFIECIKESNFRKIGLLLKNRMVPSKSTIIHAIKEHGYNKGIQCLLRGMSNILRKQIPDAIRVWSGYRTQDLHTPVFVVIFSKKTNIPEKMKFLEPYDEYEIVFRNEHIPNNEEEQISEQSEVNANTINKDDIARVLDCIAKSTDQLMNEHSNLSIVAASTVKAIGFNEGSGKCKLIQSMCIVLYVPLKGIIPVGEKEFPKDIDEISTDVREGEFVFHGRKKAHRFHQNLRMGCLISTKEKQSGTLGGFVDLPNGKTGCITAAHVVLNEQQRKDYVQFKKAKKAKYHASLGKGKNIIELYQPTRESTAFGKISQIAFEEGNNQYTPTVDAAVIEITDDDRKPDTGLFPTGNCSVLGFTKKEPMMYNSGKTRDHSNISIGSTVVKYGCSTSITRGKLVCNGASVRIVNTGGRSWKRLKADHISYPKYFNQMVVKKISSDKNRFSAPGDSGALVFMYHTRNMDLEAIGLLIGGSTHRPSGQIHIVTPIQAVLQNLGLENVMFKRFPDINEEEENLLTNELIYSRQRPEIHHEISDTKIKEQEEEIKEALKEEITEATKEEIKEEMKAMKSKMKEIQEAVRANTVSLEQIKANTSSLEINAIKEEIKEEIKEIRATVIEQINASKCSLEQTIIRLLSKPEGDYEKT